MKNFLVVDSKKINRVLCGGPTKIYTDDVWQGWRDVCSGLNKLCTENDWTWHVVSTQYDHNNDGVPTRKTWRFVIIDYDNNRQVYGHAVAAGCGTVADPLSKYDMVAYI